MLRVALQGGYTQPPTPGALHGPKGTLPAQALPSAYASGRRVVPTLGGPPSRAVGGEGTGRQILWQNSPKQSPVPGHHGCHRVAMTL